MQPPVHFLLSIVACLGVGLHLDNKLKKYLLIVLVAITATCIDLDHLLPMYHESNIAIFHNIFVFIMLPAVIFWMFFIYEKKKTTSLGQRVSLLLCVSFLGQMFLDCVLGGTLPLFFPLSSGLFTISNVGIATDSAVFSITSDQMILIIWGAIIFGANMLETLIYNDIEGSEYIQNIRYDNKKKRKDKKSDLPLVLRAGLYFFSSQLFTQLKERRIKEKKSKS
jgi:hypothetical protein